MDSNKASGAFHKQFIKNKKNSDCIKFYELNFCLLRRLIYIGILSASSMILSDVTM